MISESKLELSLWFFMLNRLFNFVIAFCKRKESLYCEDTKISHLLSVGLIEFQMQLEEH